MHPANTPAGSDRRSRRRFPVCWRAALELAGGNAVFQGRTLNLSVDGCMFICGHNIPGKGKARLLIQMPPSRPGTPAPLLPFDAHITHTSLSGIHGGFVVGLRFVGQNTASLDRLRDYFSDKLQRQRQG